jgi:hypothetical protein
MEQAEFAVSAGEWVELAWWVRSPRLPPALGRRACIVMLSAEGHALRVIAERLG